MNEVYKKVYNYYWISNYGNMYSELSKKHIKSHHTKLGYRQFNLYPEVQKKKIISQHKLVYETFKGKVPEGLEIDHIDNDPSNNKLENLQTLTKRENLFKRSCFKNNKFGEKYIYYRKARNRYVLDIDNFKIKIKKSFKTLEEAIDYKKDFFEKHNITDYKS